ncbi:hypothetical protein HD597_012906 [Nonomuraea thailandensis]|uniref:Uncharacterized protein n=1 Tax=Nonomuraea thailandensis TaxID=1188745 RepID=A0A9X2GXQ5_9ACTN|nr:hypothetical protein [Nonomuraea thailandensis]MCP2365802.1 hypothetical protein [Nonomuraea thailandensis]
MKPLQTVDALADAVVLTPLPYAYESYDQDQVVTTTAYTTREPGLLVRSRNPEDGEDGPRWLVVHWHGEAIQGRHDYTSPWQALMAADRLGALGVDWRQTSQTLKATGTPDGLWNALLGGALIDRAGAILKAVTSDDEDRYDHYDPVMDLLAAGWSPEALTARLTEPGSELPLTDLLTALLAALAPVDGRPPWCGHCLAVARQTVDERGWLTQCPQCHPMPEAAGTAECPS